MSMITSIVCRQRNANMQNYMRGYDNSGASVDHYVEEDIETRIKRSRINSFIRKIGFYIYGDRSIAYSVRNDSLYDYLDSVGDMKIEDFSNIIESINEDILSDVNFGSQDIVKNIGSYNVLIRTDDELSRSATSTVSLSYIAGSTNEAPNVIRLGITEESSTGTDFINGYVDFLSDGNIIVRDFDRCKYSPKTIDNGEVSYDLEETKVSINNSRLDTNRLKGLKDYLDRVFEISDLKTDKSEYHM